MPLSDLTLSFAWLRSGGRCECRDPDHGHSGERCNSFLVLAKHGAAKGEGAWQACRKHGAGNGGHDHLYNCEVRCWECAAPKDGVPRGKIRGADAEGLSSERPDGEHIA